MPRSSGTQTRTFTYSGVDLLTAGNPENGTVTYTYDNMHRVLTRTDAKSQQTQYIYDTYSRVTGVRHGAISGGTFTEDQNQRVDYGYIYSLAAWGRLAGMTFGRQDNQGYNLPFSYTYSYNSVGRVVTQIMATSMYVPPDPNTGQPRLPAPLK